MGDGSTLPSRDRLDDARPAPLVGRLLVVHRAQRYSRLLGPALIRDSAPSETHTQALPKLLPSRPQRASPEMVQRFCAASHKRKTLSRGPNTTAILVGPAARVRCSLKQIPCSLKKIP